MTTKNKIVKFKISMSGLTINNMFISRPCLEEIQKIINNKRTNHDMEFLKFEEKYIKDNNDIDYYPTDLINQLIKITISFPSSPE